MNAMRRMLLGLVVGCALLAFSPLSSSAQTMGDTPGAHSMQRVYGPDRPNPAVVGPFDLLNLFALRYRPVVGLYGWVTPAARSPFAAGKAVLPAQRRLKR